MEFTGNLFECFDCGKILYTEKKTHSNLCKQCNKKSKKIKKAYSLDKEGRVDKWLRK
jgi:Zn finger protein HypA/HybF involved in hydrogenase expression